MLTAWGAYGEKQMYGKTVTGVIRSTFVVDERARSPSRSTTSRPPVTWPSCAATCRSSGTPAAAGLSMNSISVADYCTPPREFV